MPVIDPNDITQFDETRTEPQKTKTFSAGRVFAGKFMVEELLGRGGMGEVWKARDQVAERDVVLKFVLPEVQDVKEAMNTVRGTFRKIHELQHQHICPVYSLENDPEHGLYIVMKYIDGMPLSDYRRLAADSGSKIPFGEIIKILWGIARGLDYAHSRKVLHRDIKPHNIILGKKDGVQIIDFGLAEEIQTMAVQFNAAAAVMGTRPYMAPEQWRGHYQDARTDQYALAVTAYELLAGHCPFVSKDAAVLKNAVLHDAPEPISDVPDCVNAAVLKGLAKERKDRFESCKEFVRALLQEQSRGQSQTQSGQPEKTAGFRLVNAVVMPKITESSAASSPKSDNNEGILSTWRSKPFPVPRGWRKRFFGKKPPDETKNIASDTSRPDNNKAVQIVIPPPAAGGTTPPSGAVPKVNVVVQKEAKGKGWDWLFPAVLAAVLLSVIILLVLLEKLSKT